MKVQIKTKDASFDVELPEDLDLMTVSALVGAEIGMDEVVLSKDGKVLAPPDSTLKAAGVTESTQVYATAPREPIPIPGVSPRDLLRAEQLRSQVEGDSYKLFMLRERNPALAEAVEKNDLAEIVRVMKRQEEQMRQRQATLEAAAADPFNIEAQRALEEEIQLGNVEQLRQEAIEHMPESFGTVTMLYINVVVNGVPLKAFVDSGAQMTIMSSDCAEKCGLMRLCDRRFAGMAVGVGTQRILGRVHMCQMQIENDFLPTSLSILEKQNMEMLLGLDMLKRHRCVLDLDKGVLRIGTTGTSTPFLPESELPESAKLHKPGGNAQPQASTTPSQAQSGGGGGASKVSDEAIQQLLSIGPFTREQAMEALTVCNNDPQTAAAYLFDRIQNPG